MTTAVRSVRIAPGNGGTHAVAETVTDLDVTDPIAVTRHASRERYDLVVIGPEAPLAAGVADELAASRIPVFGPSRAAARLESSKAFAKRQMERAGIATAASATFTDAEAAIAHVRAAERPPVVKADWLAAGKGVVVPETHEEATTAIGELFGSVAPGARVVARGAPRRAGGQRLRPGQRVDGCAAGRGARLQARCDGDRGPNTGGMGAYSPVPGSACRRLSAPRLRSSSRSPGGWPRRLPIAACCTPG